MDYRFNKRHAVHDNGVPLREPKDIYVLSHTFFKGFSERYGVDVEIKLVRYESIQEMLDPDYRMRGPCWSSLELNEQSFISPYNHVLTMPAAQRKQEEMRIMNSH